ncbi:roundabout homolog 1-like [Hermetia illucens]|uniref:roundabout homolog 1-like n=1 Tax=Hermetia illucens TaxID=343691 RepID=UPI0018CC7A49|nr:roundabout homolog 1-like [Hermetia illucens]
MNGLVVIVLGVVVILDLNASSVFVQGQQRPRILEHPADAVAARDEPLTLNCKATGRPPPEIFWYHNGTPLIPSERRVILPEGSLFFLRIVHNKREQDSGIYWCEARSPAGIAVSRNATLQIATLRDDFRSVPVDTVALVGGSVLMNCTPPRGVPEPSVLWYKDGKVLDFGGKRISTVGEGSLFISEVQSTDAGRYECSAQNIAGSMTAPAAALKVLTPPQMLRRPQDTEVIEGEGLDIPCEITGDPKPIMSWTRDNGALPEGRSRTLLDNTLRIEDARAEDEGQYTCKGLNEGGNVSITIKLSVFSIPTFVEAPIDVNAEEGSAASIPCRATGRPQAIVIWDRIQNTLENETEPRIKSDEELHDEMLAKAKIMSLRYKRSLLGDEAESGADNEAATESNSYTLSPQVPLNFEVSKSGELIFKYISKKDEGWYACAAINEAGSIVKKSYVHVITDQDPSDDFRVPEPPGSRWESTQNILITSVKAISAYYIDVSWEATKSAMLRSNTLTIYYRPVLPSEADVRTLSREYNSSVAVIEAKAHRLRDLKPFTNYEIFATVPSGLGYSVSNLRKAKTKDGPPSAPPVDVQVGVINNTAAYVRWSPPPTHLLNGALTGYKIQIKSNATQKVLGQMTLNATTQSVVINSLSPGGRYIACVAPLTSGGLGPYSPAAALHMDPSFISRPPKTDSTINSWSISWMPGIALAVLGVCLISGAIFAVFWAQRTKRNLKASYPGPALVSSLPDKSHTLWMQGNVGIKPTQLFAPSLMQSDNNGPNMQTLPPKPPIRQPSPPEPYATVTLQRRTHSDGNSFFKNTASPSSSDYNDSMRIPPNLCDVPPPPPPVDHCYESYKPPNNMTIRTNPAALSPQIMRRTPPSPPSWRNLAPPIPTLPQNWIREHQRALPGPGAVDSYGLYAPENDYETDSVLYEEFCGAANKEASYFNEGGEPTEEYYRNVNKNLEYLESHHFDSPIPSIQNSESPNRLDRTGTGGRYLANLKADNMNSMGRVFSKTTGPHHHHHRHRRDTSCDRNESSSSDSSDSRNNRWVQSQHRTKSRSRSGERKYRGD